MIAAGGVLISCGDGVKREPGRTYMPDMAYSRAYETYSVSEEQKNQMEKEGIHFSNVPVAGTIKRGVDYSFRLPKDVTGDSTHYIASKQIKNPIASLDSTALKDAERLYLINCGICHGTALDGNGPLFKGGEGPYAPKPANLGGEARYVGMPDGQMFYSITYGKNMMGSYASQLNSTQRWMVISYIRSKQAQSKAAATATTAAAPVPGGKVDSTAKK